MAEPPVSAKVKMARIGVTVPAAASGPVLAGHKAAVYDLDSGILLPAEAIDLHIGAGEIVTATVRVVVSEIVVGTIPGPAGDG